MNQFLFDQYAPFERLKYVRITLALMVLVLLTFGPYDSFYVDMAPWLFKARFPFPWFPNLGSYFWVLKGSVMVLAVTLLLDFGRGIRLLFAFNFLAFNFYITCFGTTYWITNTHLNIFALILCLEPRKSLPQPTKQQTEIASWIVAFMVAYIAILYFQAGLSKLLLGGLEWFWEGKRVWTETILLGTPFGKWLVSYPLIFQFMGIGTAVFELAIPFLFLSNKSDRFAAIIAILFHLSTFAVMGISFWFLWAFYPALFFSRPRPFTFQMPKCRTDPFLISTQLYTSLSFFD